MRKRKLRRQGAAKPSPAQVIGTEGLPPFEAEPLLSEVAEAQKKFKKKVKKKKREL